MNQDIDPNPTPIRLGTTYYVFPLAVKKGDRNFNDKFLDCAIYDATTWDYCRPRELVYHPKDVNGCFVTFVQGVYQDLVDNHVVPLPDVDDTQLLHSASAHTLGLYPDPLPTMFAVNSSQITIPALEPQESRRGVVLVFMTKQQAPQVPEDSSQSGFHIRPPGLVATRDPEIKPSTLGTCHPDIANRDHK